MLMYSISDDQKELFTIDEQVAKIDADGAFGGHRIFV